MRLRQVTCAVCHNGSHNQYGHRSATIPFDDIAQSERWPTLFIHHSCATELTRTLMVEFGLDASHPFIAELYEPHQHERF